MEVGGGGGSEPPVVGGWQPGWLVSKACLSEEGFDELILWRDCVEGGFLHPP